jgi:MtrB/PioB family decaheme-associated outer membrane protein
MKTSHKQFPVRTLTFAVQGALVAMFALPMSASADSAADVAALTQPTNTIEVGIQNASKDSAKFGEYNGLDKKGVTGIGNFNMRGGDAYGSQAGGQGTMRYEFSGSDLGTTSREVRGSVSDQGKWSIGASYDQLRHNFTDSYQTPYQGSMGGNTFTLPDTFLGIDVGPGTALLTADQLAAFRNVKVHTERQNIGFNAEYLFNTQWSVQFDYNRLDQSGAKLIGASGAPDLSKLVDGVGNSGAGETMATLMNPTNYKTDTYNLSLNWVGDDAHFRVNYFASIFKDNYRSISWDNPFYDPGVLVDTAPSLPPYPSNVLATAPDNEFHQLNFSGGYDFSATTKLAGGLSYGRNTQHSSYINDPLYVYDTGLTLTGLGTASLNFANSPLPRSSLDGRVITTHADLKLTNQTSRDLALSAGFKYDERDNQTPSDTYGPFASIAGDPWQTVVNTPVSNRKTLLELAANYRIDKAQNLRFAYEYENIKRWCNNTSATNAQSSDPNVDPAYYTKAACVQVGENKENKLSASYKLKASGNLTFNTGYSYARRRADVNSSYYNPMQTSADGFQNAGYVGYFDASRKEQIVKAGVNWQASDTVNIGLNGRYTDDKYDATLGVQKGNAWSMNLDASYAYSGNGSVSAYLSTQRRQRDLLSSAAHSPIDPVPADTLWSNRLDDATDTLGINFKQKGLLGGKLELYGDLSYSLAKTRYSTNASGCTNVVDTPPNGNSYTCFGELGSAVDASVDLTTLLPSLISGELPTIKNETTRLKLTGAYQLDKTSKVVLTYLYKKLKSEDYFYGAYQYGNTDPGVLPTNQQAPSYSVNVFGVSYIYSFQ